MDYVADSKRLTLAGAKKMMETATDMARKANVSISVAIADAGGHMILMERMDGGRFHTVHSSTTKAACAASNKRPTTAKCAASNKRPTTAKGAAGQTLDTAHAIGLALAAGPERWTAMEVGYPVIVDGECIGGIGVSGGNWEFDDNIARSAVESIGASWQIDK